MGRDQLRTSGLCLRVSTLSFLALIPLIQVNKANGNSSRPSLMPVSARASDRFLEAVSDRLHQSRFPQAPAPGLSRLIQRSGTLSGIIQRNFANQTPSSVMAAGRGTDLFSGSPLGFWGKGYGLFGQRDAKSGVTGYGYDIMGAGGGLDYQYSETWLVGMTVGFSGGNIHYTDLADTTHISATNGGLYASFSPEHWYLDSIITGARMGYETERQEPGVSSTTLKGSFNGWEAGASMEAGFDFWRSDNWLVQPLVGLRYSHMTLGNYAETGGVAARTFGKEHHSSLRGSLGVKVTHHLFEMDEDRKGRLELRARWQREFKDTHSAVDVSMDGVPGSVLLVTDTQLPRNSALLGAGLQIDSAWGSRIRLHYDTRLSAEDQAHIFSTQAEFRW